MNAWRPTFSILLLLTLCGSASPIHAGGVPTGDKICSGTGDDTCPPGEFCEVPAEKCDDETIEGECVIRPEICTMDYNPVCGCDGRSYGNDCGRRGAGVRKNHDGECAKSGS